MKKLIAGILSAAMTLGCIALPAEVTDKIGSGSVIEASAETYGSFEYTVLDDGTVKITGYSGTHSILNIPAVISSKQVTVLGDNAFDNSSFTELYIPNGIKSIGKSTFANCDSIKSVTIPGSVESIGEYAFESCDALETVTISEGVTELGNYAFNWCKKLSSVTLPDSLRRIKGAKAFYNTDIVNNQTTPVKYVEKWAVQCDSGLTSASVNGAVGIADSLFSPSKKTLKKVIIFEGVKYIGYFAFSGCEVLTDVTLPDGLESICGAFYECTALESVTLPDGLKSMDNAFSNCSSLTSVYIPDGITEIGDFAFFRCYKLKTVNIPESVTVIGESAFNDCNVLSSITLPDKLETIEDKAFANCTSLKSITIPKSVKNLSESFNPIGYFGQIDYIKFSGFKIYCYSGTSGEQYAKENGFDYEVLDHTHSYTSKITKAATCTATGVRTYTCSCGDTYTQTIAKTAHTYKTT
ncbi:MAG: leucine-rich repeat domain-containing protein, partial [Oscillospiraceae bacterium]